MCVQVHKDWPSLRPGLRITHSVSTNHSREAYKKIVERCPFRPMPHVVADAAFGSIQLATEMATRSQPIVTTCSMNEKESPYVWALLARNLQQDRWCAVFQRSTGVLLSAYKTKQDEDDKVHKVITTGFYSPKISQLVAAVFAEDSQEVQLFPTASDEEYTETSQQAIDSTSQQVEQSFEMNFERSQHGETCSQH